LTSCESLGVDAFMGLETGELAKFADKACTARRKKQDNKRQRILSSIFIITEQSCKVDYATWNLFKYISRLSSYLKLIS
jgi:hypothetical protein